MKNQKISIFKDKLFVHYELQNLLEGPIYIENVKFENHLSYDLIDYSTHNTGPEYEHSLLKNETRRFLYQLKPKDPFGKVPNIIGKVLINWRSSINQTGQMGSSIQHKPTPKPEIEIIVKEDQKLNIQSEKPFNILCSVYNRTNTKVDLILIGDPDKMFPICMNGITTKKFGTLEPNSSLDVSVELFCVGIGIQSFGNGLTLKDTISLKIFNPPNNLCNVLVE